MFKQTYSKMFESWYKTCGWRDLPKSTDCLNETGGSGDQLKIMKSHMKWLMKPTTNLLKVYMKLIVEGAYSNTTACLHKTDG